MQSFYCDIGLTDIALEFQAVHFSKTVARYYLSKNIQL